MRGFADILRPGLLLVVLVLTPAAAQTPSSGFGAVAIPEPPKTRLAAECVEPVEVMRREHMHLLDHQRDRSVIDGERDGRYSLVACMDCHNPVDSAGQAPRYDDEEHFCAACHTYASVDIDCFECHADRGYGQVRQSLGATPTTLSAATLQLRLEQSGDD